MWRSKHPCAFSLTLSCLFQSSNLIRSMVYLPVHSRSDSLVLHWKHVFGLSVPQVARGARADEANHSKSMVLVFHCHMVTSAFAMHQFKQTQSLVFRCHMVTSALAIRQLKTDPVFSIPCHAVTGCAMQQFKQTQYLVFRCHAVIRRMRNVTDSVSLFNVAMLLRYSAWAWAVNKRPCVHFLCKLHWQYYIIQHFFSLSNVKLCLFLTQRNSILNF